jgi:KDO2-lipid IV(A) lauroyltransferase
MSVVQVPHPKSVSLAGMYIVMAFVATVLRLVRWRRRLVEDYVDRCLPELAPKRRQAIVTGFYRYLGELAAEVFFERFLSREALADHVRFENVEDIKSQLRTGRRVLMLSAHCANWEWLLLRCSTEFEAPLTAVYRKLRNNRLDRHVRTLRERFGSTMVRTDSIVQHLLERRGDLRLLAMLADQSPAARNEAQVWIDFFGHPTAFHCGPGLLFAQFGFAPYFAAVRRESRGHYVVRFVPLITGATRTEAKQVLQAYARAVEAHVREHPEQYFWAYKRWKRERPLYG